MRFTRWDQELSTVQTNAVLTALAGWHLDSTSDCQEKRSIAALLTKGDYLGLCQFELDYSSIAVEDARHLRQVLAFFQKRSDLDIGDVDRQRAALDKFEDSETKCRETNEIFRKYARGGFFFLPRVESVLFRAQRKIADILGDVPSLEALRLRFGPGATTDVRKKDASARRKLSSAFACSEDAIASVSDVLAEMPQWAGLDNTSCPESVSANVHIHMGALAFARKNAQIDRVVIKEPMLNSMVQLGIGEFITDRLAREGVNLRDQSPNQRLARLGSLTGEVATLDLTSASDLNANGFVESMLPYEWWSFLRSFRTGTVAHGGKIWRLEKFSSMGNGFTFPLESLLFYALAYACIDPVDHKLCSVYGDDIIVPTYAYARLVEVLTAIGHTPNTKKSFWAGPFRESCGADYLSGINVRPCYIKGPLTGHDAFRLHNFYARQFESVPSELILQYVDESLQIWGPDGFGDGHLITSDESRYLKPHRRELGWGGYTFETFTYKPRRAYYKLGADYVYPSYSIYVREPSSDVSLHGASIRGIPWGRATGSIRPDRGDAAYVKYKGKVCLEDTLPGYQGYKRIKIYLCQRP